MTQLYFNIIKIFNIIEKIKYCNLYNIYTFSHLKCPFYWTKNKKKCKINSRSFTYDGLTFSSSF